MTATPAQIRNRRQVLAHNRAYNTGYEDGFEIGLRRGVALDRMQWAVIGGAIGAALAFIASALF